MIYMSILSFVSVQFFRHHMGMVVGIPFFPQKLCSSDRVWDPFPFRTGNYQAKCVTFSFIVLATGLTNLDLFSPKFSATEALMSFKVLGLVRWNAPLFSWSFHEVGYLFRAPFWQTPEDPLRVYKVNRMWWFLITVVISASTVQTTTQSSHSIPVVA